jgi:heme exporter protein D
MQLGSEHLEWAMSEFFEMGGYAVYVWPSFILTAVVLVWALIAPWRQHRRLRRRDRS